MPSNPFFSAMNGGNKNMMQMLNQLKSNPVQFLLQRKFNVPNGMNNPQEILQHLTKTGQIDQQQINNAYQIMQKLK